MLVVLNLAEQAGETDGFSPEDHLEALFEHAPELRLDTVLADPRQRAAIRTALERAVVAARGASLVLADVARRRRHARVHDPVRSLPRRMRRILHVECVRIGAMAMTAEVKDELASTPITKTCCRKAEVSAMLRFAGGLHIVSGRIVVEAELDTGAAARRLRKDIAEIYGHTAEVRRGRRAGLRKGSRYVVRVVKDGEALARQTGLLDQRGRPVRGLPPQVVSGGGCDAVAAWRGAFLAHGSLTEPGRSSSLEVTCPGPRPRSPSSAPPAGSASRPRPARCAASTGWSSATATPSAPC